MAKRNIWKNAKYLENANVSDIFGGGGSDGNPICCQYQQSMGNRCIENSSELFSCAKCQWKSIESCTDSKLNRFVTAAIFECYFERSLVFKLEVVKHFWIRRVTCTIVKMDYSPFIDPSMKLAKYNIYSNENILIEVRSCGNARAIEQHFNLTIEKHRTVNLIQIRLSSVNDKTMIFLCSVDDGRFEQFKIEQSLHVTFEYFVNHITQMFDDCRANKLNMVIVLGADGPNDRGQLQFYEKGTFKNLIHISLPIERAPIEVILFYVNESYAKLQEQNRMLAQSNNGLSLELQQKSDQAKATADMVNQLKAELSEQQKVHAMKQKEQMARLEQEFKQVSESKDFQKQELEKQISAFRSRIDTLVKENYASKEQYRAETKVSAQLRGENKKLSDCVADLQLKLEQLKADQMSRKNATQKSDHIHQELRKQMQTLQEKISGYEKQNSELMAELDAEKNICQIKRNGLKMATEDICNANTIIRKQAAEIAALREKIDWRTEVALKQEQVIREKGKVTDHLTNLMQSLESSLSENAEQSKETEDRIKSIEKQTEQLQQKYERKMEEIYNKIHAMPTRSGRNSSTSSRRF